MNIFLIANLLTSATGLILTIILLVYGRTTLHRLWMLLNLFVFIWGVGTSLVAVAPTTSKAWLGWKIACTGGLFLPPLFYHITNIFVGLKNKIILFLVYFQAFLFFLLVWFTKEGVILGNWQLLFNSFFYNRANFGYAFGTFNWVFIATLGLFKLVKYLKQSKGSKHAQAVYLFLSFLIGFIGGGSVLLPALGIPLYPIGNFGITLYVIVGTYAILKYRLMDINVAITRAGIFGIVYIILLGIPLWMGYKLGLWQYAIWAMLFSATIGPYTFMYFSRKAEARFRKEEFHAHDLLKQASKGMIRIHNIRELLELMVHIINKILKLDNAAVFITNENSDSYNLSAVRLKSKYQYLQSLNSQDPLIQKLSTSEEPIVYEEVKLRAQELKDKPDDPIHEIEAQMRKLQSAVIIPIVSKKRLLGFLVLGEKKSKRMYSPEDLATLSALSYQAALAIENAIFYEKEKLWLAEQSKRQALADMAPGASHQFDNRLSTISATADNLLDLIKTDSQNFTKEQLMDTVSEELEVIRGEVQKGKQITAAILQKAKVKLEFDKVDISKVIQNAINLTCLRRTKGSLAGARDPKFVFNYSQDLPLITLCEGPIQDVFENMFNNAFDAIVLKDKRKIEQNYQGKISIDIAKQDSSIIIRVEDNGIGIPKESLHKLFTPLFTTKATSEKGVVGGSGLGLCVMRSFIEDHSGTISVESEHTKWTRFTVSLPLEFKPPK